jgi:hypothetical protein
MEMIFFCDSLHFLKEKLTSFKKLQIWEWNENFKLNNVAR